MSNSYLEFIDSTASFPAARKIVEGKASRGVGERDLKISLKWIFHGAHKSRYKSKAYLFSSRTGTKFWFICENNLN